MKNEISTINDIRKNKEGNILLMTLAVLTVSPKVCIKGKMINGRKTNPEEMLSMIINLSKDVDDLMQTGSCKPGKIFPK